MAWDVGNIADPVAYSYLQSKGGNKGQAYQAAINTVTAKIGAAVLRARGSEDHDPREIVDLTFDAFGKEGAGALASWMIINGNQDALDPILEAIHRLVDQISDGPDVEAQLLREETLQLTLMALGDALLGGPMARALDLPREKARELAAAQLLHHNND